MSLKRFVLFAEKSLVLKLLTRNEPVVVVEVAELRKGGETEVYNLTTKRDNVYYANGVLVENCADALLLCYYNKRIEPHIWIV